MLEKNKISIVTITYDNPRLEDTLESVAIQDYNNLELIVIDGFMGTDNNAAVEYKSLINVYLNEKDDGIYDAMNKAQEYISGDYVLFLNAGDTFLSASSLSDSLNVFEEQAVYFSAAKISDGTVSWNYPGNLSMNDADAANWARKYEPNHQAIFFPAGFVRNNKYDLGFHIMADADYKHRSFHEYPIKFTGKVLVEFMLGGKSTQYNSIRVVWIQILERIRVNRMYLQASPIVYFITPMKFLLKYIVVKVKIVSLSQLIKKLSKYLKE